MTLTDFKNNSHGLYPKTEAGAEEIVQSARLLLSKPRDWRSNPRAHGNQSYVALCVLVILAMRKEKNRSKTPACQPNQTSESRRGRSMPLKSKCTEKGAWGTSWPLASMCIHIYTWACVYTYTHTHTSHMCNTCIDMQEKKNPRETSYVRCEIIVRLNLAQQTNCWPSGGLSRLMFAMLSTVGWRHGPQKHWLSGNRLNTSNLCNVSHRLKGATLLFKAKKQRSSTYKAAWYDPEL